MIVRITIMILRVSALLALVLGLLFWVGMASGLVALHMLLGILVTLALWTLGGALAMRGGSWALAAGALVLGLLVVGLGLTQTRLLPNSFHWSIQVVHLLLGLAAIGLGEAIASRYKRLKTVGTPVLEKK